MNHTKARQTESHVSTRAGRTLAIARLSLLADDDQGKTAQDWAKTGGAALLRRERSGSLADGTGDSAQTAADLQVATRGSARWAATQRGPSEEGTLS
ncbi:hypothetical protein OK074_1661 [Actinobacteria bacterium OK074]|nr:hypothetical protein OK074_1661 [Actinobacteria bacterium OK074]